MTHEENKQQVIDAVNTLLNTVNGGRAAEVAETIYQTISHEHRTLQQSFWNVFLLAQIKYADNPNDVRNEAAVKLAQAVKETASKLNFDYGLPYV